MSNKVELVVPLSDKIHKFIFSKGIAIQELNGNLRPVHRAELLHTPGSSRTVKGAKQKSERNGTATLIWKNSRQYTACQN